VIADRVGETPCVFLAGLHRAERTIADRPCTLPAPSHDVQTVIVAVSQVVLPMISRFISWYIRSLVLCYTKYAASFISRTVTHRRVDRRYSRHNAISGHSPRRTTWAVVGYFDCGEAG
jgi:hypothetical protein